MTADEPEREIVSRLQGEGLANNYRDSPDPFTDVSPSLLAASDIERYVRKTGLISPFFTGGGDRSRLKKASYEGRIGSAAYVFQGSKGDFVNVLQPGKPLRVKANSIVFVECDLDFRLPRNIALRFNLQIVHVHRGLLLGTGPLVDPGYWGKLCIPLHNLTNEHYDIPLDEGLIWIEFTKTTADNEAGRGPPKDFWDIRKFLIKASRQFDNVRGPIGIASSIPESAKKAEGAAEKAAGDAASAAQNASDAKTASEQSRNINIVGAAVTILTVLGLWASFYFGVRADTAALTARIDALQKEVSDQRAP